MKSEIFKLIVNRIHRYPPTIDDQYVGTITIDNKKCTHIKNRQYQNEDNNEIIVFVLESPHIDEFLASNLCPLANDTYFWNNLNYAIENSSLINNLKDGVYALYFINAIQYQCSLGDNTTYYRDIVFLYLWDILKSNFENRLNNLINNNSVTAIVNLCTNGNHSKLSTINANWVSKIPKSFGRKFINYLNSQGFNINTNYYSLKGIVENSINGLNTRGCYYTIGKHPSSWYLKNNLIK